MATGSTRPMREQPSVDASAPRKLRIGPRGVQTFWIVASLVLLTTQAPAASALSLEATIGVATLSLAYVLGLYCGDVFDSKLWTLRPTRISGFRFVVRVLALAIPAALAAAWLGAPTWLVALQLLSTVVVARVAQIGAARLGWHSGLDLPAEPVVGAAGFAKFGRGAAAFAGFAGRTLKRTSDIVAGLVLITAGGPLYLLVAAAILLEDGGPVRFSQVRVGRDGRTFRIHKFRSMRRDAEAVTGPVWSTPDDERATLVGRWLRVTRLDELPQAWNLLRGDMSLVGPRPERPEFEQHLRTAIPGYELRHTVRPGLTGWAQVNLPQSATLESARRKIRYDLYYVGHASVLFDLYILGRSARILLREFEDFLASSRQAGRCPFEPEL